MATITATAAGGTRAWSDTATWVGGVVPTAADDVVLDASSGVVTISSAAVARSLNCSAYTSTLTHNASVTLSLGDATAGAGNAALTLGAGMTYSLGSASTSAISFVSTSTTQQSITMAGKTCGNLTFNGTGGTWIFSDTVTSGNILVSAGALSTGNQTITCAIFNISGATATAAIGTSTLNLTATTAVNVFLRSSGGAFTAGAATLNIVNASSSTRTFSPNSSSASTMTLNYTVAGSTGTLNMLGTFSIAALNVSDSLNGRTVQFAAGTTYTFGTFNVQGSAAGQMTIVSSTPGTPFTLTKSSRVVSCDYLTLSDVTATGGASWYAGTHSVNNGNVTGWMFTAPSNYQFLQFAQAG